MNIEKPDDAIDKYLAAESTLEEEKALFNGKNTPVGIERWSTYVAQKKKKAPPHLQDTIWAAIQTRKRKRQRMLAGLSGVAASIVLLVSFLIYTSNDKNMGYDEKEASLNEALSMFANEEISTEKQNILYEDDLVIVYLNTN